jgi:hypothetical protein
VGEGRKPLIDPKSFDLIPIVTYLSNPSLSLMHPAPESTIPGIHGERQRIVTTIGEPDFLKTHMVRSGAGGLSPI